MELTFYHAPNTRSSGIRVLLEELGAPYRLHPIDMTAGEQRQPAFLAINPLGKVPAVVDGGSLITEQVALYIHLADRFPAAALAPALDHPDRGPYLRWIAFYGSSFEPAVVDHAQKREPGPMGMSPYGTYTAVIDALEAQLRTGPWLLGERFTAADVLWGMALSWTMRFQIVPERPAFTAYAERFHARPAAKTAIAADQVLVAEQQAARASAEAPTE